MEDECFSGGFKVLLENSSGADLEHSISEEGLKGAEALSGNQRVPITFHPARSSENSDWSESSFVMIVCDNFCLLF